MSKHNMLIIEVISAWSVNTYYNVLYEHAIRLQTRGVAKSITDGYIISMRHYLQSFTTRDGFRRNLTLLYEYYVEHTRFASMTFTKWLSEMISQFFPPEFSSMLLSTQQQNKALGNIILNSMRAFAGELVVRDNVSKIVAQRGDKSVVGILKESMRACLLAERTKLHRQLYDSPTEGGMQIGVRNELNKLVEENIILKNRNDKLKGVLKRAATNLRRRDQIINDLTAKVAALQSSPIRAPPSAPLGAPPMATIMSEAKVDAFRKAASRLTGIDIDAHDAPSFDPVDKEPIATQQVEPQVKPPTEPINAPPTPPPSPPPMPAVGALPNVGEEEKVGLSLAEFMGEEV